MRLVYVTELVDGMVLERDVINESGLTVLTKDTVISESHISSLNKMDIDFVYVYETVTPDEKVVAVKDLKFEYERSLQIYKEVYMSARLGRTINKELIYETVTYLLSVAIKCHDIMGSFRELKSDEIYTYRHGVNVCIYAGLLAKWSGLPKSEVIEIAMAGFLHDIGKAQIPLNIINKPERLNNNEFDEMKRHVNYSAQICEGMGSLNERVVKGIREHHERLDGTGYPNAVKADQIGFYGRVLAIADVFDAITTDKVYQKKMTPYKAIDLLRQESFGKLDTKLSAVFIKRISQFYVGNRVKLNDGTFGEVVLLNTSNLSRPLIKVDGKGYVDLSMERQLEIMDVIGTKLS